jgi:hypothetical protein
MKPAVSSKVQKREPGENVAAKLPALINREITLHYPHNKPGNVYLTRVLEVADTTMRVSVPRRIAGTGHLKGSAPVVLDFVIAGKLYECVAQFTATEKNVCQLSIQGEIKPTTRRHFSRLALQVDACYVPISDLRLARKQFANLPWKRSKSLDLSAGGVLIQIPFQAPMRSYLLLNLEIPNFQGPLFVFGQVRWGDVSDIDRRLYLCGIRFITREELKRHFSPRALSQLPPIMLPFTKEKQHELNAFLRGRIGTKTRSGE